MSRYPLAPLLELTGWPMTRVTALAPCGGDEYRRRLDEGVTELIADRLATAAHRHPCEVWPDFGTVPCPECSQPFTPTRRGHRFCGDSCRERRRLREKYQTDPEYAERKRAARRRYYAEAGAYERARERRKYHERTAA